MLHCTAERCTLVVLDAAADCLLLGVFGCGLPFLVEVKPFAFVEATFWVLLVVDHLELEVSVVV